MQKKGIVWQELIPWLLALGVLVLIFILYGFFSQTGSSIWDSIWNALRFGR